MDEDYKRQIGEAVGEASMCWEFGTNGLFLDAEATAIVDRLVALYERKGIQEFQDVVDGDEYPPEEPIMDSVREAWIKYTESYQSDEAAGNEFDRLLESVVLGRLASARHKRLMAREEADE